MPDEIQIEAFKELGEEGLEELRQLINRWWIYEMEDLPIAATRARIALIFKKGDAAQQNNYRPISLLNSICNVVTG